MEVLHYVTADGRDVIDAWLDRLRDKRALAAILRRIGRITRDGYFGDHRHLRDGVSELRSDEGVPAIVSTTPARVRRWCCFSAVGTNRLRMLTSSGQ
jgi:hypothetical protein